MKEYVNYQLKDSDTEETERSAGKREQTVSKKKLTAKDFQYLVNTTHYDEEDGGDVYKVMEVVDEVFPKYGMITVAYRSQMLPKGEWLDFPNDPIDINDIVELHNNIELQAKKEERIATLAHLSGIERYMYLVDTTHYDNDDDMVYKVVNVREGIFEDHDAPEIVCDRHQLLVNGEWKPEVGCVYVRDVVNYHENENLQARKEEIMAEIVNLKSNRSTRKTTRRNKK